jgi:hypothetical protein
VVASTTPSVKTVLILFPFPIVVVLTRFSFARALNPLNIFPSNLEVVLLLLNPIFNVFVYEDLDTIVVRLVRVLVREDFDFLKLFVRNLAIVFQGTVYYL